MTLRPLAVALGALALALGGGAAATAGAGAPEPILPAPPPSLYCRVPPEGGWPDLGAGYDVDLSGFQDYRGSLAIPAGQAGSGVAIADVEYEWSATHADLVARGLPTAQPTGLDALDVRDHGTAVLGMLGAADDGHGITGLAPAATLRPVSPMFPALVNSYQPALAIDNAAKPLGPGDVLLIEQQSLISTSAGALLGPIEYYGDVRDAITRAVKRGIVVVEPAGNGNLDVGTLKRSWLSDPADALASGALMVGAGGSGSSEPLVPSLQRVPGSNWGARLDVQGVGTGVVTTGYPGAGRSEDHAYTSCFDGTSSASATVAGAVAVLQSAVVARRGTPLTPAQVREVLRSTGLPQAVAPGASASDENIGPRPQVSAALASVLPGGPPPPSSGGDGADLPGTGAGTSSPVPVAADASVAATPPRLAAAGGLSAVLDRRRHRLTVRISGLARASVVTVGTRRVAVRAGRLVLTDVRPGRLVVRVTATGRRAVAFRITVPVNGPVRIARIP